LAESKLTDIAETNVLASAWNSGTSWLEAYKIIVGWFSREYALLARRPGVPLGWRGLQPDCNAPVG